MQLEALRHRVKELEAELEQVRAGAQASAAAAAAALQQAHAAAGAAAAPGPLESNAVLRAAVSRLLGSRKGAAGAAAGKKPAADAPPPASPAPDPGAAPPKFVDDGTTAPRIRAATDPEPVDPVRFYPPDYVPAAGATAAVEVADGLKRWHTPQGVLWPAMAIDGVRHDCRMVVSAHSAGRQEHVVVPLYLYSVMLTRPSLWALWAGPDVRRGRYAVVMPLSDAAAALEAAHPAAEIGLAEAVQKELDRSVRKMWENAGGGEDKDDDEASGGEAVPAEHEGGLAPPGDPHARARVAAAQSGECPRAPEALHRLGRDGACTWYAGGSLVALRFENRDPDPLTDSIAWLFPAPLSVDSDGPFSLARSADFVPEVPLADPSQRQHLRPPSGVLEYVFSRRSDETLTSGPWRCESAADSRARALRQRCYQLKNQRERSEELEHELANFLANDSSLSPSVNTPFGGFASASALGPPGSATLPHGFTPGGFAATATTQPLASPTVVLPPIAGSDSRAGTTAMGSVRRKVHAELLRAIVAQKRAGDDSALSIANSLDVQRLRYRQDGTEREYLLAMSGRPRVAADLTDWRSSRPSPADSGMIGVRGRSVDAAVCVLHRLGKAYSDQPYGHLNSTMRAVQSRRCAADPQATAEVRKQAGRGREGTYATLRGEAPPENGLLGSPPVFHLVSAPAPRSPALGSAPSPPGSTLNQTHKSIHSRSTRRRESRWQATRLWWQPNDGEEGRWAPSGCWLCGDGAPGDQQVTASHVSVDVGTWMLPQVRPLMWQIQRALERIPGPPSGQLKAYRGLAKVVLSRDVYDKGRIVVWGAFSSSSKDQGVATAFAGSGAKGNASVFTLMGKTCKCIAPWSRFAREEEWLFQANTTFHVVDLLSQEARDILKTGIQLYEMHEVTETEVHLINLRGLLPKAVTTAAAGIIFHVEKELKEAEDGIVELSLADEGVGQLQEQWVTVVRVSYDGRGLCPARPGVDMEAARSHSAAELLWHEMTLMRRGFAAGAAAAAGIACAVHAAASSLPPPPAAPGATSTWKGAPPPLTDMLLSGLTQSGASSLVGSSSRFLSLSPTKTEAQGRLRGSMSGGGSPPSPLGNSLVRCAPAARHGRDPRALMQQYHADNRSGDSHVGGERGRAVVHAVAELIGVAEPRNAIATIRRAPRQVKGPALDAGLSCARERWDVVLELRKSASRPGMAIGDIGAHLLADVLELRVPVRRVGARNNGISCRGAARLLEALRSNPHVEQLTLGEGTREDDEFKLHARAMRLRCLHNRCLAATPSGRIGAEDLRLLGAGARDGWPEVAALALWDVEDIRIDFDSTFASHDGQRDTEEFIKKLMARRKANKCEHKAPSGVLLPAARCASERFVNVLLDFGADPQATDAFGEPAWLKLERRRNRGWSARWTRAFERAPLGGDGDHSVADLSEKIAARNRQALQVAAALSRVPGARSGAQSWGELVVRMCPETYRPALPDAVRSDAEDGEEADTGPVLQGKGELSSSSDEDAPPRQRRRRRVVAAWCHARPLRAPPGDVSDHAEWYLKSFALQLYRAWHYKAGDVLDECITNLAFPPAVCPLQQLHQTAGQLRERYGRNLPSKQQMWIRTPSLIWLLIFGLYTMHGVDIDRMLGFPDVPEQAPEHLGRRRADEDQVWEERPDTQPYYFSARGRRNARGMPVRDSWRSPAHLVCFQDDAHSGEGLRAAWRSLRRWVKLHSALSAIIIATERITFPEGTDPHNRVLYRTATASPLAVAQHGALQKGQRIAWPAPEFVDFADRYLGRFDSPQDKLHFRIHGEEVGLPARAISEYPCRGDVLLPAMTVFTVDQVDVESGCLTVDLISCGSILATDPELQAWQRSTREEAEHALERLQKGEGHSVECPRRGPLGAEPQWYCPSHAPRRYHEFELSRLGSDERHPRRRLLEQESMARGIMAAAARSSADSKDMSVYGGGAVRQWQCIGELRGLVQGVSDYVDGGEVSSPLRPIKTSHASLHPDQAIPSFKRLAFTLLQLLGRDDDRPHLLPCIPAVGFAEGCCILSHTPDDVELVLNAEVVDRVAEAWAEARRQSLAERAGTERTGTGDGSGGSAADGWYDRIRTPDMPPGGPPARDMYGDGSFTVTVGELRWLRRSLCVVTTNEVPARFYMELTAQFTTRRDAVLFFSVRRGVPLFELDDESRWKDLRAQAENMVLTSQSELAALEKEVRLCGAGPRSAERAALMARCHGVWSELAAHRAARDHLDDVAAGRAIALRFKEWCVGVLEDPRGYGFADTRAAQMLLRVSLTELSTCVCQSQKGYLLVECRDGARNQLAAKPPQPVALISAAGVNFDSAASMASEAPKYFARERGAGPDVRLGWKGFLAGKEERLLHRVLRLYRAVFEAAQLQGVRSLSMLPLGLGRSCRNVDPGDVPQVRAVYYTAQYELLCEKDWGFVNFFVNPGGTEQLQHARQLLEQWLAGGRALRCAVVFHNRDAKGLAGELARLEQSPGLLVPSHAQSVLQGHLGMHWEMGRGEQWGGEEDIAATSTATLALVPPPATSEGHSTLNDTVGGVDAANG